jgi:hypothetical protein
MFMEISNMQGQVFNNGGLTPKQFNYIGAESDLWNGAVLQDAVYAPGTIVPLNNTPPHLATRIGGQSIVPGFLEVVYFGPPTQASTPQAPAVLVEFVHLVEYQLNGSAYALRRAQLSRSDDPIFRKVTTQAVQAIRESLTRQGRQALGHRGTGVIAQYATPEAIQFASAMANAAQASYKAAVPSADGAAARGWNTAIGTSTPLTNSTTGLASPGIFGSMRWLWGERK